MKLLRVVPSSVKGKRYTAVFEKEGGRTRSVSFGSATGSTYIDHRDDDKKKAWLARHSKAGEDWNKPDTAGALSRWLLWHTPSFRHSLKLFRSRFNL